MHVLAAFLLTLPCAVLLTAQTTFETVRTIDFAGRPWEVRTGFGGPGPNHWSDSPQSVWVDAEGKLHLKLRCVSGVWRSVQVRTAEPTQYGMHRFYVSGAVDVIDRNVVFAPFLYANDSTEIDMNFSRWGWTTGSNLQYVVQPGPYLQGENFNAFSFQLSAPSSTHYIDWSSSRIRFKSLRGHYPEPPDSTFLIQEWTYVGTRNPRDTQQLRAQLSLWLIEGRPPTDGREIEVVIARVDLPALTPVGEARSEVPTQDALHQNHPNPFSASGGNPSTTIGFRIPASSAGRQVSGFTSLKVYDVLGREMRTLVDEELPAGRYSVVFSAEGLSSGVYFYRLTSGSFVETKKMVLTR